MSFGMPFESLPPEMQEALRAQAAEAQRQHDLLHMNQEASRHRVLEFIESLSEDDLLAFRGIISEVGRATEEENIAAVWYLRTASHVLANKFGFCVVCDVKHSTPDDLFNAHPVAAPPKHTAEKVVPVEDVNLPDPEPSEPKPDWSAVADETHANMVHLNMERWRVESVVPDSNDPRVKCKNCGMEYVSLKDRMLREPDDCSGCKASARWGGSEVPDFDPSLRRDAEGGGPSV